jgi:hypothetical protein
MASGKVKASRQPKSKSKQSAPRKQARPSAGAVVSTIKLDEEQLDSLALKIADIMFQREEHAASTSYRPNRSIRELAYDLLQHPEEWLRTPNSQLGDRKPIDLMGTDEEFRVQNLLNAVDLGLF